MMDALVILLNFVNTLLKFCLILNFESIWFAYMYDLFQTFLMLDELKSEQTKEEEPHPPLDNSFIKIDNVTARWDPVMSSQS